MSFGGTVMADDRKSQDRPVQRSFERHRLEEQLWSLAYQYLWSVMRMKSKPSGAKTKRRRYQQSRTTAKKARSA
jgi:hypothetical protein